MTVRRPTKLIVEIERWGDNRIAAKIPFKLGGPNAAKSIAGATPIWQEPEHNFRFWSYPLTMEVCRRFREVFGDKLEVGPNLTDWAWDEVRAGEQLEQLRAGGEADLPVVRSYYPTLWKALQARPFQIAGAAFIKQGRQVCLGDEPRLGKTYQALAAAIETGSKSILIVCPRTAVRTVWARKIKELLDIDAYVALGERDDREWVIEQFHGQPKTEGPKFLIVNHRMIRIARMYCCLVNDKGEPTSFKLKGQPENRIRPGLKGGCQGDHRHRTVEHPVFPSLFKYPFDMIVLDESHNILGSAKHVISKNIPQIRLGAMKLPYVPDAVKLAMSGTPFRHKNVSAWGTLNWLDPVKFSSFWRFAEEQFIVTPTGYQGAKVISNTLRSETVFQDTLRPYYLARTKAEVAPQLPPIEYAGTHPPGHPDGPVGVYLDMVDDDGMPTAQQKAYWQMEEMGLATLMDGRRLTANSALAELTRLRQFACSQGSVKQRVFFPSAPSCKLDWILDFLEERRNSSGKVVIASQWTKFVKFYEAAIRKAKWEVVTITGESTDRQREHAQDVFMNGSPRVCIINMYAGGEAIDLSAADEMIITDEPWVRTVIEQTENRIQSLAKRQQLTVYRLRAANSIEADIAIMTDEQRAALLAGRPQALEELVEIRNTRQQEEE